MSAIKLSTPSSGSISLSPANTASNLTITVPAIDDTMLTRTTNIISGTAVASTSGTAIDFTGIPSWAKRITVMFNGVSTSGTSTVVVRFGTSSGIESTGYASGGAYVGLSQAGTTLTTGFIGLYGSSASDLAHGTLTAQLVNSSTNLWVANTTVGLSTSNYASLAGGSKALAGTLTQLRITAVNGTDTFDAGSINILYE